GGISVGAGIATVTNSTLSGNEAFSGTAGGISNRGGTVTLTNSTLSNNTGPIAGIDNDSGTVTLINTIVAGQSSFAACSGTITAGPDSLASDGTCGGATQAPGGDAMLAPLGNYGGPTQTHALLPGSPAIDAANH